MVDNEVKITVNLEDDYSDRAKKVAEASKGIKDA
ncbi:hypothetical protein EZS27_033523 [termite gut metagenome]|uniref:Uncharacterized protein n=1 Tax=termite gut metagenome TaxID=433724 RepID=A0A5J4Q4S6_9ZZZZ